MRTYLLIMALAIISSIYENNNINILQSNYYNILPKILKSYKYTNLRKFTYLFGPICTYFSDILSNMKI